MRILLSGNFGFIGSVLQHALVQQGHYVTGIDSFFYGQSYLILSQPRENFTFVKCDIAKTHEVKTILDFFEPQVIIHLASLVGEPICRKYPAVAAEVNREATRRLVKLLKPEQRLITYTTNSGYGNKTGKPACDETDTLEPISVYGHTKAAAEIACLEHGNSVSMRLATVAGLSFRPRFDLLVNDWTAKLFYDKELCVYEPHYRRNFIHIDDVVDATLHFINRSELTGVYNVADDNMTKLELAETIVEELMCPDYEEYNVRKPQITVGEGKDTDQRDYFIDSSKLHNSGFRPMFGVRKAIADVIGFCVHNPKETTDKLRNI